MKITTFITYPTTEIDLFPDPLKLKEIHCTQNTTFKAVFKMTVLR
eukprot:UN07248